MKYKLGIIGAGFLTETAILPALKDCDNFEIVALLDEVPSKLKKARDIIPILSLCTEEDEFWKIPMDAVYIASPNHLHANFGLKALERNLPVLIEKPLAHSCQAAEELIKLSDKRKVTVMSAYMAKLNRYNIEATKIVKNGDIGEMLSMTANFLIGYPDDNHWRLKKKYSGFGALGDVGIYPVTTAIDFFGSLPESCVATSFPAGDIENANVYVTGHLGFPERKNLNFTASFLEENPECIIEYILTGTKGILQVKRTWAMDGSGGLVLLNKDGKKEILVEPINPYLEEFRLFAECIGGKEVPLAFSGKRAYQDVCVLDALERSAALQGKSISFDV